MSVAVRSTATVVNTTAGTSVTVTRPAGTVDGDLLVAYIAEIGTGTITAPAGWTLVGTRASGTSVTIACYRKTAAGEPASWTWTLGASVRNFGLVHAVTGADPSNPISSSVSAAYSAQKAAGGKIAFFPRHGLMLTGYAAVLAATGTPTTWTPGTLTVFTLYDATHQVELADVSTNGGTGSDLTGTATAYYAPDRIKATTSWIQGAYVSASFFDAAATFTLAINPAVVAYDGGLIPYTVEAAFGANPISDPATWTWTDVTADVLVETGVRITKGRSEPSASAAPTSVALSVRNMTGDWTPDNPTGARWPNVDIGLPLRVTVPYGAGGSSRRATVFVDSYAPAWDDTAKVSLMAITASGRMRRIQNGTQRVRSSMFQTLFGSRTVFGYGSQTPPPYAYWPMEDGPVSTGFSSVYAGHPRSTRVLFTQDETLLSSDALPVFTAGAQSVFRIPAYVDTGKWVVQFAAKIPSKPAAETLIAEFQSAGTVRKLRYSIVPTNPAKLRLQTLNASNAQVGECFVVLDGVNSPAISEAQFFGQWAFHTVEFGDLGGGPDAYQGVTMADSFSSLSGTAAGVSSGALKQITLNGGTGFGFGHLVVNVDPAFRMQADLDANARGFTGHNGEDTSTRGLRICAEQGEPADVAEPAYSYLSEQKMGPQPRGTLGSILRDCEAVDSGGVIYDGGPNGEILIALRQHRYNRPVDLTIDMAKGELALGFSPVFDDQRRVDDITVTRSNGGSARWVASGSRGNTSNPTLNLYSDSQLDQVASWRLRLGTARGYRYPQISINLRRTPWLAPAWLECDINSRVLATHLPATHPSTTDADVIVEGFTEVISKDRWEVSMNVSSALPYSVYAVADQTRGRLDTASQLAAPVSAGATSLLVVTKTGTPWITTAARPGDFPFDGNLDGEQVRVTASSNAAMDAYGRTVSGSWSSPDIGPAYTTSGGTGSDYAVASGTGRQSQGSVNVLRHCILDIGSTDVDLTWDASYTIAAAASASAGHWIAVRMVDVNNYYAARLLLTTGGLVQLDLVKRVAGVLTSLTTPVTIAGAHAGGEWYTIRPQLLGKTFRAKVWRQGLLEPPGWHATVTDTSLAAGTQIAAISRLETGNTNTLPVVAFWDNLVVRSPQQLTVTRSINGVVKAQAAGAPFSLWRPAAVAL